MDFCVRFEPSGRSIRVSDGTSLLEAVKRAGLPIASSCGADGVCGRCGLQIIQSSEPLQIESARECEIKERNRIEPRLRLACRLPVQTDLTVGAPYW